MKCHPGPAALGIQPMNLALHSEKQISISANSSLVIFFLNLPPSLCSCFMHELHNKLKNALNRSDGDYNLSVSTPDPGG